MSNADLITLVNKTVCNELIAVQQYFLDTALLKHWGYQGLAQEFHTEVAEELEHANLLIDRLLQIGGSPSLALNETAIIMKTVPELFANQLRIESVGVQDLKAVILAAEQEHDFHTRTLAEQVLAAELKHQDWLETQLTLIENLGLTVYLQAKL